MVLFLIFLILSKVDYILVLIGFFSDSGNIFFFIIEFLN